MGGGGLGVRSLPVRLLDVRVLGFQGFWLLPLLVRAPQRSGRFRGLKLT